jgi:hypothetical protein
LIVEKRAYYISELTGEAARRRNVEEEEECRGRGRMARRNALALAFALALAAYIKFRARVVKMPNWSMRRQQKVTNLGPTIFRGLDNALRNEERIPKGL